MFECWILFLVAALIGYIRFILFENLIDLPIIIKLIHGDGVILHGSCFSSCIEFSHSSRSL